jgi:signal peptidase II
MKLQGRSRLLHFLLALALLELDRLSKVWIIRHIAEDTGSIPIVPGFFSLTHVENPGAAFGFMASSNSHWATAALIACSSLALLAVGAVLWKVAARFSLASLSLALILGGAGGNLWDRLLRHHVTDFLHCYVGTHVWPDFNLADSAIVCGACLLVLDMLRPQRQEGK